MALRTPTAEAEDLKIAHGCALRTLPDPGEMIDWVLVLDDASRNYPEPGARP